MVARPERFATAVTWRRKLSEESCLVVYEKGLEVNKLRPGNEDGVLPRTVGYFRPVLMVFSPPLLMQGKRI